MKRVNVNPEELPKRVRVDKLLLLSAGTAVIIILSLIIFYFLLNITLSFLRSDGIDNYKGAAKELASKAVLDLQGRIDNKQRWLYTVHVNEVRPTTADEVATYCTPENGEATNNPDDPRYYTAIITMGETLSPYKELVTVDGCVAFGPKKDREYRTR